LATGRCRNNHVAATRKEGEKRRSSEGLGKKEKAHAGGDTLFAVSERNAWTAQNGRGLSAEFQKKGTVPEIAVDEGESRAVDKNDVLIKEGMLKRSQRT